jgi:3-oxosteroid 1-dehydrogenase
MNEFYREVDVVVVGSGAGSMCFAQMTAKAGKSVLLLEKSPFVGGTTARSGGVMWIPNNPLQARDGVVDSYEEGKKLIDNLVTGAEDVPGSTPARREALLREGPKMLEYLMSQGVRLTRVKNWPDYYDDRPGGCKTSRTVVSELFNLKELGPWQKKMQRGFLPLPLMLSDAFEFKNLKHTWKSRGVLLKFILRLIGHILTGKKTVSAGLALQGQMMKAALAAGVEFCVDSPVEELLIENDKVTGVVALINGQKRRIKTSAILMDSGGFAKNQAMRDKYQPHTNTAWSNAVDTDTGEMIEEMQRLGAATNNMDMMVGYQTILPPGKEKDFIKPGAQQLGAHPHAIVVDQTGVRFQNEGGSYVAFCRGMLDRNKQTSAVPSWIVMDSRCVKSKGIAGVRGGKKLKQWQESGYLKVANSLSELAELMAIDPNALMATVERFNGFVSKGVDEDFGRGHRDYDNWLGDKWHRPSASLGAIDQAPFYAVPVVPGDVGTYGGVVTDEYARVLKDDGSMIEGLYATGVCTASAYGRVYPGAGASIGPAYTFAFIAANHLLNQQ